MATRVYKLEIEYPEGSHIPDWTPELYKDQEAPYQRDPWTKLWQWPRERMYLSQRAANRRATLLRNQDCQVRVVRSFPIEWEDESPRKVGLTKKSIRSAIEGLKDILHS